MAGAASSWPILGKGTLLERTRLKLGLTAIRFRGAPRHRLSARSSSPVDGMCTRLLPFLLVLLGCRTGGPSADPLAYVETAVDATDATQGAPAPADDGSALDDSFTPSPDDAMNPTSDDAGSSAADGGGVGDGAAGDAPVGSACMPTVAVCDPVHNTGCNPLQQCDVDSQNTTASKPTGLCVFPGGGSVDASPCTATFVNESCAPKSTCVSATCRLLCFCTSDCPTGQCCSDTSGPLGFRLCRTCP